MRVKINLKHNIALRIILISVLLWFVVLIITFKVIEKKTYAFLDESLKETAERILPLAIIDIENRNRENIDIELVPLPLTDDNLSYQIQNKFGQILVRSHRSPMNNQKMLKEGFSDKEGMRVFGSSTENGDYLIYVFEPIAHREEIINEIYLVLLWPLILLIPLIYWSVYQGLSNFSETIQKYSQEISKLSIQDLKPIAIKNLPREIAEVGNAVNYLITRLRSILEKEKNFSENIAHEFRTPISVAKAQLEVARIGLKNDEVLVRLIKLNSSLDALENLVNKFLQLTRAETNQIQNLYPINIELVTRHTIETLKIKNKRYYNISILSPIEECLGDEEVLGIILLNLLENANQHSDKETPINVVIGPNRTITIQNEHPTLTAEQIAKMLTRYERGSRKFGLGIGLSITQMLAEQINATMEINSPIQGKTSGVEVAITLSKNNLV